MSTTILQQIQEASLKLDTLNRAMARIAAGEWPESYGDPFLMAEFLSREIEDTTLLIISLTAAA